MRTRDRCADLFDDDVDTVAERLDAARTAGVYPLCAARSRAYQRRACQTSPAEAISARAVTEPLVRDTMQRMAKQRRGDGGLARFGEPGMLVLISLSDGPKHGYAITTDVLEQTGMQLGPGTLYGSLTKLVDRGLVTALAADERRRPYELTEAGRAALTEQLATWSRVVKTGRARLAAS